MIDLKALREYAERATSGERIVHIGFDNFSTNPGCYGAYIEVGNAYNFLASGWSNADKSLYCALNPAIVLALLDSIEEMKRALEYYADEKNWYSTSDDPKIRMTIGSLDTEGPNWIGGRDARQALEANRKRFA